MRKSLLWRYIGDSLRRGRIGFGAAAVIGIPVGLTLGWYPAANQVVNPVLQILRPISPIAWIPVAIILFGVGDHAAISLIFLGAFFPIVVACVDGVSNVPSVFRRAGRNFGLTPARCWPESSFPAALPQIIVGLRIALGIAWLVVVAAEMIAVDSGLGYLVIDSRNSGKRYDLVVAAMLMIGLIGLVLDRCFRRLEKSNRFDGDSAMSLKAKIAFGIVRLAGADQRAARLSERELGGGSERLSAVRKRKITVAYIPVTCQLTCPVTDYISKYSLSGEMFLPRMFQGFPEIKEALISNRVQAAFIVAPLAIALRVAGRSDQGGLPGPPLRQRGRGPQRRTDQDLCRHARPHRSPFPAASPTSACCCSAP